MDLSSKSSESETAAEISAETTAETITAEAGAHLIEIDGEFLLHTKTLLGLIVSFVLFPSLQLFLVQDSLEGSFIFILILLHLSHHVLHICHHRHHILEIIKEQRSALYAVCLLALGYIFICALVIFNVEPETFPTFFDVVYWATVSLTTVGYGDIYPVSAAGRVISMLSSVFGIAIIALPAGIITAGFLDRIRKKKDD